jgi:hypothetical protein
VGLVSYIQAALTLVLAVLTVIVLASIRAVRGDVSKLLGAFQRNHGEPCSAPTGAAVVTPSPLPPDATPAPLPEPAARAALPLEPASVRPALPAPVSGGLADEVTLPSEGTTDEEVKAALRAKVEREADERSARRAVLPPAVDAPPVEPAVAPERASRPSDEPTQVFSLPGVKVKRAPPGTVPRPRPVRSERPTLVGGAVPPTVPKAPRAPKVAALADAPMERPVSSARRAAETWTAKPAAALIAAFQARLAAASPVDVAHCGGADCNNDAEGVCSCGCAPCDRRRAHFSFAASDVRQRRG